MDLDRAARCHLALAHALLDFWEVEPRCQQVLHHELLKWPKLRAARDETVFRNVARQFRSAGLSKPLIEAALGASSADDLIKHVFDEVLALTAAAYRADASWDDPTIRLDVKWNNNRVYPDAPGYGELGCAASVRPRRAGEAVEVVLLCVPGLLGPPSWASVPYLFCHELVCHAGQAAPHNIEDPYTEGFMDEVALQFHDQWRKRIFPWQPALAKDAALSLAMTLRRQADYVPQPHDETRDIRRRGAAAASRVAEVVGAFANDAGLDPDATFRRLALQLNRVPADYADHARFVQRVNASKRRPERAAALAVAIRRWGAGDVGPETILFFS
jgi:hypothetical protein